MPSINAQSSFKLLAAKISTPSIYSPSFAFTAGIIALLKPFSLAELTARVDALFRRVGGEAFAEPENVVCGPFILNTRAHTLEKSGKPIRLTQVEYAIVKLFMTNAGRSLSREEVLTHVWGEDYEGEVKIVDVNIRRIRIKLEDDAQNPKYLTTVWGFGYKWCS